MMFSDPTPRSPVRRFGALSQLACLSFALGCGSPTAGTESTDGAATSTAGPQTPNQMLQPSAAGASGAVAGAGGTPRAAASTSTAKPSAQMGALEAGSGAAGMSTASGGTNAAGSGGEGAAGAAGIDAAGGPAAGVGAAGMVAGAQAAGADAPGEEEDATTFAAGLSELFLDAACDAATRAPLEQGATCNHAPNTQRIEEPVTFGGEPGTRYQVTLRVRGIWEPTNVTGGMRPYEDVPFTIGGQVASGAGSSSDAINYQQYFIEVAEPKQTYWLNDHQYVAHDIHKEDYEASITVAGGSAIKVVMNDGNEREIANFPKEILEGVPPYDKTPSLGQSLRLDVVRVEVMP